MSTPFRHRLLSTLALLAIAATLPATATAQSKPSSHGAAVNGRQSGTTSARPSESHWLEDLTKLITPESKKEQYKREHTSVMGAFRDVVGRPSKSTVRVYCDAELVALGTIVDVNGIVLTKDSELRSDSGKLRGKLVCELAEGSRYPAHVITTHQHTDLALLQLPTGGLPAIQWSDTSSPTRGSWVVTPGLGDQPEAIGVVSVTAHTVRGGVLGIFLEDVENGARVSRVLPGGGAAKAGIVDEDVISQVNGKPVTSRDELVAILNTMPPGETIQISLYRGSQPMRALAKLGSMNDTFGSRRAMFQNALGSQLSQRKEAFPSVFEHDSVLTPNECGGPIVDLEGNALGINIARASRVSSYALPAVVVRQALSAMLSKTGDLAAISHPGKATLVEAPTPR